jgi:hypothetical protein
MTRCYNSPSYAAAAYFMTESSNRWLTHRLQDKLETEVGRVLTQLVDWQRNGQPTRKWGLQASSSRRSASASVSRGDRSRSSSMRFEASALDSAPSIVSPASLASVSGYERCAAVIGFVKQIRKHETVVRQVRSTQPPRLGKAVVTSGRSASMNCPVPPKYSLVRRHEVTTDRRRATLVATRLRDGIEQWPPRLGRPRRTHDFRARREIGTGPHSPGVWASQHPRKSRSLGC